MRTGTHQSLSDGEPWSNFQSIEGLLNAEVDDLILPASVWEQTDVPSPWTIHFTEAATYNGGLELVLATGPGNPAAVRVWTAKNGWV